MTKTVPAYRVIFSEEEIERAKKAVEEIMRSGRMILGKYTEEFEKKYAALAGRRYGISCSSDTAALEIALRALGIGPGDQVVFPANGFYGVLVPVLRVGAQPLFIDIDLDANLFASAERVEAVFKKHSPAAIILMHCGGYVARDSFRIRELCEGYGVVCIEDCAHAIGAYQKGRIAGSFGDVAGFSLYATKPINAGEGGILLTDDVEVAEKAKVLRNYGRTNDFSSSVCVEQGYSWRITEYQAAIALGQIDRLGEIVDERIGIMNTYDSLIEPLLEEGIEKWKPAHGSIPNGYRYMLLLPKGFNSKHRAEMKRHLQDLGVYLPGEVYELCVHHQPVWNGVYSNLRFPNSEDWAERHFCLPVYNGITYEDMKHVVKSVLVAFRRVCASMGRVEL